MPRLSLITSKSDVFFATTAPEFFSLRGRNERTDQLHHRGDSSPPSSPHCNFKTIEIWILNHLLIKLNGIIVASPDGKPFRLYRIQLNNLGSSSANCPSPVGATPRATRNALRREPKDLSPSPPARGSPSKGLRTAGAARKDLRIRLEHQGSFGSGSGTPGSPASSRNLKARPGSPGSPQPASSTGSVRSCAGSPIPPLPGSSTPPITVGGVSGPSGIPNSVLSSSPSNTASASATVSTGSPKGRTSLPGPIVSRKLSLMAEELEGIRHVYLSPPSSPKIFSHIHPQNSWEAFK